MNGTFVCFNIPSTKKFLVRILKRQFYIFTTEMKILLID